MNVVIIDDEPMARETIKSIIVDRFPEINIVGQAGSVQSAIETINITKPDLVFLDVDLTDGYGFDILTILKPINFKVIFITAHQEYAIKAIKFSAFDFILKPVSVTELSDAITRVKIEDDSNNQSLKWNAFFSNISDKEQKNIVLKTSESIHLVNVNDIIKCEADNNYSTFYLVDGKKIVISKGLKEYEDMLGDLGFFRVHQSHLINLKFVSRYDKRDGGFVVLKDESHVPVSQRKKQKLLDFFDSIG